MENTYKKRIVITGGAGFIGSHMVRKMVQSYPNYLIINVDKLTYAGNLANLQDIELAPNTIICKKDEQVAKSGNTGGSS